MSAIFFVNMDFGHARKEGVKAAWAVPEGVRKVARRIAARYERRSGKAALASMLLETSLLEASMMPNETPQSVQNMPCKKTKAAPSVHCSTVFYADSPNFPGAMAYHAEGHQGYYGVTM